MHSACRICGNDQNNRIHHAREMMLGLGDEFDYLECSSCGTLQLTEIPDLARYYPQDYYSFEDESGLKPEIARQLARSYVKLMGRPGFSALRSVLDSVDFEARVVDRGLGLMSVLRLNLAPNSRILDVGCGAGKLLTALSDLDYRSLTGTDPFLARPGKLLNGVRLLDQDVASVKGEYDLVMFHHSFEHLVDPKEGLSNARRLLATGGTCLVRIPLANYAWEHYGVNWVGLDAPRHIFLFTEQSFRMLAEECGFKVEEVVYDSTSFQFSASEQYLRGIPLVDPAGARMFTRKQIAQWSKEAESLNERGRGDQAAFYLKLKDQ